MERLHALRVSLGRLPRLDVRLLGGDAGRLDRLGEFRDLCDVPSRELVVTFDGFFERSPRLFQRDPDLLNLLVLALRGDLAL